MRRTCSLAPWFLLLTLGIAAAADPAPPRPNILFLVADDLDTAEGRGKRSPHEELQSYLNRSPELWGIVANGRRLRVLRDFHHEHVKAYVGFDLDAIFEAADFPSFRTLYRLVHRSRTLPVPGDDGKRCPLELLFEKSREQGVEIGRELQRQVRTAIEALAAGTPVVATRAGALPEVLGVAGAGVLVPPADGAALAKAIGEVLEHWEDAQREALAARPTLEAHFGWPRVAARTAEVYETVLERWRRHQMNRECR